MTKTARQLQEEGLLYDVFEHKKESCYQGSFFAKLEKRINMYFEE